MSKLYKIQFLKDTELKKKGDIANCSKKNAESYISNGYAEYYIEDNLNWDQKKAIELDVKGKLPELAKQFKREGRQAQANKVVKEIVETEQKDETLKRDLIEKKEIKEKIKIQKKFLQDKEKEENKTYIQKMEILSLLAKNMKREATEELVKYIESKHKIYTTMDDIKSEMWIYDNGVYKQNGKSKVKQKCRDILGRNFTTHLCNEVLCKIEADTYIDAEEFFKNNYVNEIPVQNGILNIKTKKLNNFNPKKIFFNKLPIKYNPKAKCPSITKHFRDVLKKADDVNVMFEIFGFFLYKDYFIEKAIMFVGDGRNGKGKTIDLMKRFLGLDNCCSVTLNSLSEGGFRIWDLFGKMANLAGDLSSNALKDTAILKQTTGRDLIGADRKNKTTVNFVNHAKHTFACNELPRVYDFSRGFWERWVLFEFPYTFVKKSIYDTLNKEKKENVRIMDPFIIDKLTTEEELSGLLNEAILGLHRILKQKDFSYSVGVEEIKQFWVRKSDSFTAFAMDHLEESYNGTISKQKLRKAFLKYCNEHKIRGASDKNIKVVLEEMFGATDRQDYETKARLWEGINFKEKSKYMYMEGRLKKENK